MNLDQVSIWIPAMNQLPSSEAMKKKIFYLLEDAESCLEEAS